MIVTPKRWNGVVASSGGSWNRPQLIAARSTPSARFTVATSCPQRYSALNRANEAFATGPRAAPQSISGLTIGFTGVGSTTSAIPRPRNCSIEKAIQRMPRGLTARGGQARAKCSLNSERLGL